MRYAVLSAVFVIAAAAAPRAVAPATHLAIATRVAPATQLPAVAAATQIPAVTTATQIEDIIGRGLRAAAGGRYEAALREFGRVVEKEPGDAAGYFFLASVYSVLVGHFDDTAYREGFERNAFRAGGDRQGGYSGRARRRSGPHDRRPRAGDAGRGRRPAEELCPRDFKEPEDGDIPRARDRARPGPRGRLLRAGLYYYWRVRAEWFRRLAPLIGDTGEKGIRYIRRTAERGRWLVTGPHRVGVCSLS